MRVACVVRLAVSRPASGSVTPKHILSWLAISRGISLRFCSAVPNFTKGIGPKMFRWSALAPVNPAPLSATACMAMAASVTPRPEPPSSTGMAAPSHPASAMAATKVSGNSPVSSVRRQ